MGYQAYQKNLAGALEFAILTATRTGEVLGAKWREIDIAKKLWIIPAKRMKRARSAWMFWLTS
jgi:integrase